MMKPNLILYRREHVVGHPAELSHGSPDELPQAGEPLDGHRSFAVGPSGRVPVQLPLKSARRRVKRPEVVRTSRRHARSFLALLRAAVTASGHQASPPSSV